MNDFFYRANSFVYAIEGRNEELMAAYPDRQFYISKCDRSSKKLFLYKVND
jgi:adenosine/AMP kinase